MKRNFWIVVVVLSVLIAACGSDDDGELSSIGSDGDASATDDSNDDSEGDTSSGDDGDDDEAMTGDSGSDWCDAVRQAADDDDSPIDFNLLGLSAEEVEAQFTQNVAVVEEWEATAPPEISADVTTMADAFRTLVSLAEAADWNLMVMGTDPAFAAAFDNSELEAAADNIDGYSRDVCGVDLDTIGADAFGDGVTTTPSEPATGTDGDTAAQFLETFGLPANFLNDEQLACVNDQLSQEFPDGVPSDLTLDAETVELFNQVGAACGIGIP